jgi:hypothetical protein
MPVLVLQPVLARRRAQRLVLEGRRLVAAHDLEGAEAVLRQAMTAARGGAGEAALLEAGHELYEVLLRRRRRDEAVPVLEDVVAAHARRDGPGHERTATWRNELIRLYAQLGRPAEAEAACRDRLGSARARRPSDPQAEGLALTTLAWCVRSQGHGRWDEAERLGLDAVAALESDGVRRGAVGWALAGLAAIWLRRMQLDRAEAALRRAATEWSAVGRSELVAAVEEQLMDLCVVGERHGEALALSEAGLGRRRVGADAMLDRERQLRNIDRHAFLLRVEGRAAEAARYELRGDYIRRGSTAADAAGSSVDPAGPAFEGEPLPDWGLPGVAVAARVC